MGGEGISIAIIDDYEGHVRGLDAYARLKQALPSAKIQIFTAQPLDESSIATLADAHYLVLIRERTRVTAELLDRLPALRGLVQTGGVGDPATSHIDLEACTVREIEVIEGGASDGHAAAELAWSLVMNTTRHVHEYLASMAAGTWQRRSVNVSLGQSLRGQTMGILGYGRIGQLLANYAKAFEMNVLVWGREKSRQAAWVDGVTVADSRDALFKESDVLALQLRLNAETRHSVTRRDLGLMKPTALLVNTARAALIEPGALSEALQEGRPGRVALDVYDAEPITASHPFQSMPGCVLSPHIGYVERHSYEVLFSGAFEALIRHLQQ